MLAYNQYKQGEIIEFPTSIQELLSEEPAAKKSESLSRGKRVPKQKDDNEVGAAVCKEIHIDGLFYN